MHQVGMEEVHEFYDELPYAFLLNKMIWLKNYNTGICTCGCGRELNGDVYSYEVLTQRW
jgi:hypothetical protein